MVEAILFDCDGVLYDSERLHHQANAAFLMEEGYSFKEEWLFELVGTNPKMDTWYRIYQRLSPCKEDYASFTAHRRSSLARSGVFEDVSEALFEDIPSVLKQAKEKGYKLAVASSSKEKYLLHNLEKNHIIHYFDAIMSGEHLHESKPNPEIYLKTAQMIGVKPEDCAVIEDSYYGIKAGNNAGMLTIAIRDHFFNLNQSEAKVLVNNCSEALTYLNELSCR